ncbi:MAG: four helix bundle protein [Gemmatimonas sp.]
MLLPLWGMQDFRRLLVWRQAHDLAVATIRITARVPRGNAELVSQVRRATASIGANIAEGAHRTTSAQFAHFLGIALASLAEAHNHLLLLRDAQLMNSAHAQDLLAKIDRLRPMLLNLQARVRAAATVTAASPRPHTPPSPSTHDPQP